MSEIGLVVEDFTVTISVAESVRPTACQIKSQDCLRFGSIVANGQDSLDFVGKVTVSSESSLQVVNRKSYSSLMWKSPTLEADFDIVPPPKVCRENNTSLYKTLFDAACGTGSSSTFFFFL